MEYKNALTGIRRTSWRRRTGAAVTLPLLVWLVSTPASALAQSAAPATVQVQVVIAAPKGQTRSTVKAEFQGLSGPEVRVLSAPQSAIDVLQGTNVRFTASRVTGCTCLFQWSISGSPSRSGFRKVARSSVVFTPTRAIQVQAAYIKVSGNARLVPRTSSTSASSLSAAEVRVTPLQALRAAELGWGFTDDQIDPGRGIIRATVDAVEAWAVVVDEVTPNPGPGNNTIYTKIVVVVNALTGRYTFAYPASPAKP